MGTTFRKASVTLTSGWSLLIDNAAWYAAASRNSRTTRLLCKCPLLEPDAYKLLVGDVFTARSVWVLSPPKAAKEKPACRRSVGSAGSAGSAGSVGLAPSEQGDEGSVLRLTDASLL